MATQTQAIDGDVISKMKNVDRMLADEAIAVIPVAAGMNEPHHPTMIKDERTIPVSEKLMAAGYLGINKRDIKIDAEITQEDIDTIKRKSYVATLRDFDRWLIEDYLGGVDDQVKKAWLLEVYPEWFERQKEAIDQLNDVKRRYEIMRIEGPTTLEDIYFMFKFEQDKDTYEGSIANYALSGILGAVPKTSFGSEEVVQKSFERGLFNTRKRFNEMFRIWMTVHGNNATAAAAAKPARGPPSQQEFSRLNRVNVGALGQPYEQAAYNVSNSERVNATNIARVNPIRAGNRDGLTPRSVPNVFDGRNVVKTPGFFSAMNWRS
jgi:hypothetical protein